MARWEGYKPFRAWLESELAVRDWKPIDLARRMNPDAPANVASSISRWMLGKRQPDTASCATLAEILGVDLDTVLALAGHRPANPRSGDELINSIAASLQSLPRAQVEMISTTVRALHDEQVRKRAEAKGSGEGSAKRTLKKAMGANTAMALAPIEVLIAAQHVAPVARRVALLCLMAFGVGMELN